MGFRLKLQNLYTPKRFYDNIILAAELRATRPPHDHGADGSCNLELTAEYMKATAQAPADSIVLQAKRYDLTKELNEAERFALAYDDVRKIVELSGPSTVAHIITELAMRECERIPNDLPKIIELLEASNSAKDSPAFELANAVVERDMPGFTEHIQRRWDELDGKGDDD